LPEEYVSEHTDDLVHVIKQSTDPWIRGLCLAALVKYGGSDYNLEQLRKEMDEIQERIDDA
jgi:hypothetical protein